MTPKIDGTPINDRTDWRHNLRPHQGDTRVEGFPGIADRFAVASPRTPLDLAIVGKLEAATLADLVDQQRAWQALVDDELTHTVELHGRIWSNMLLGSFSTSGIYLPAGPTGQRVTISVQFLFVQLVDSVEAVAP